LLIDEKKLVVEMIIAFDILTQNFSYLDRKMISFIMEMAKANWKKEAKMRLIKTAILISLPVFLLWGGVYG